MQTQMSAELMKNEISGILRSYAQTDGSHHRLWCLDQILRIITGCEYETKEAVDSRGTKHTYLELTESDEYKKWVEEYYNDGEYEWDTGIAP